MGPPSSLEAYMIPFNTVIELLNNYYATTNAHTRRDSVRQILDSFGNEYLSIDNAITCYCGTETLVRELAAIGLNLDDHDEVKAATVEAILTASINEAFATIILNFLHNATPEAQATRQEELERNKRNREQHTAYVEHLEYLLRVNDIDFEEE